MTSTKWKNYRYFMERDEKFKDDLLDTISHYQRIMGLYDFELASIAAEMNILRQRIRVLDASKAVVESSMSLGRIRLARLGVRPPKDAT